MTSTWRSLALTTAVIAGSGLMFLGQQSASADTATPCVTTTSATVSVDLTGTGPAACGIDARDDSAPLDPPEPVCEILPQLCETTTTTVPDETTSSTTTTTTDPGPTDPPTDTVTSTTSTTATLPTLPTTSTTSSTSTTSEPSTTSQPPTSGPATTTSSSTSTAPGTPGGGTGTGGGTGGGTSAPTGTLGTAPVDVEGSVGAGDCTGLQCADQSYLDALGSRTQQNAAVPAATAGQGALARTGAELPSMTTLAGGLLLGGALLLTARRRLTPGYARRH
ncbi:hypothetical protein [Phycicoccus sp. Root101]|uniref:hypothetical protein n=1 Tax=Phycicoccus sp. Root101 TaxID=1736421 RepID=UPI0007033C3B|nr:hypothetical protein [Phycicoccus sp. Root101]KQU66465.1 hypothetical protein ASC58_15655 [Phycicoccus sp. Root101]